MIVQQCVEVFFFFFFFGIEFVSVCMKLQSDIKHFLTILAKLNLIRHNVPSNFAQARLLLTFATTVCIIFIHEEGV